MPSIFVLGATGYIGGSVLVGYKKAYPDYDYVALVRSESNIPAVEGKFLAWVIRLLMPAYRSSWCEGDQGLPF